MSDGDKAPRGASTSAAGPLAPDTIAATNVRPAFETSLHFGATEAELEQRTGLTRALLEGPSATVSGDATYRHMELMFEKPGFERFLVTAAGAHNLSSLGVVGLACKTVATVGEAIECHHRFQHLTNRTATYASDIDGERLVLRETRPGPLRLGSLLISDYTMLIAAHLFRQSGDREVAPIAMRSRRAQMSATERSAYESFVGAEIELGAEAAALVFDRGILDVPVASADPELARYFADLLARATRFDEPQDSLLGRVKTAIRDALVHGTPTAGQIAKRLGLGPRTLARRLTDVGMSYSQVLESTRRTLAEGYLADPTLSLAEIAYLLGYREQASFFRAFRKWHGQTPATFRRGLQPGPPTM